MSAPAWIEDARRMLAEGHSVRAISRALGVSRTSLRYRLNINGARDQERTARRRSIPEGDMRRSVHSGHIVTKLRSVTVTPPLETGKISLPFVAILAGHVSPAYQMVRL